MRTMAIIFTRVLPHKSSSAHAKTRAKKSYSPETVMLHSFQSHHESGPIGAIEGAVLDGLAQVLGLDAGRAFQVCDGARNFQDAVVGSGRQAQALNSRLQQLFAFA